MVTGGGQDRDNRGSCADAAFRHQGRHQIQCGFRFWWWVPKLNASKMELGTVAHATNHEVYALRVVVIMMVMATIRILDRCLFAYLQWCLKCLVRRISERAKTGGW
uniref:HDC10560 n=1 Tax=Drosophila melanogaster TaxID=7227 RepID=Q6IL31_DROME|nr:TPA_inf: HDC10560 [Drosophila melanogaster]